MLSIGIWRGTYRPYRFDGSFSLKRDHTPVQKNLVFYLPCCKTLALVIGVFMLFLPSLAKAAPPLHGSGKLIKPGQLLIDGLAVKCGTTPALINDQYPDFGAARRGLIILNARKQRHLPRDTKLLIYYHECAHQYVGGSELAADCWAVQKVRREGLMNKKGLKNACSFIAQLPANRSHPPGKIRCRQMIRCYNNTFLKSADKRLLRPAATARQGLTKLGFSAPRAPGRVLRTNKKRR